MYLDTSDFVRRYMTLAAYLTERTGLCCTVYVYSDLVVVFNVGDQVSVNGPYHDITIFPDEAMADVVCILSNATDNLHFVLAVLENGFEAMERGYYVEF